MLAIDWGWGIEETADRLMQESDKAQENGPRYALRTARAAARVVEGEGRKTGQVRLPRRTTHRPLTCRHAGKEQLGQRRRQLGRRDQGRQQLGLGIGELDGDRGIALRFVSSSAAPLVNRLQ